MDASLYEQFAELGDHHWWFVARRRIVHAVLTSSLSTNFRSDRQILDLGCGTGEMLPVLGAFGAVEGIDCSPWAIETCKAKLGPDVEVRVGNVPGDLPTEPVYDLIAAFDVLEHLDDDHTALRRMRMAIRAEGRVVVTVPAYPILWGAHDEASHHKRRYTRQMLESRIRRAGFEIERASYFNSLLLPAVVAVRVVQRLAGRAPASDLRMLPRPINAVLAAIFGSEARVLRHRSLPAGVSLIVIASVSQ